MMYDIAALQTLHVTLCVEKEARVGKGRAWTRHVTGDRLDNHVGTRLIDLGAGRAGIISHGWVESRYVHLWEPEE